MGKVEKLRNPYFRYKTCAYGLLVAFFIFVVHQFTFDSSFSNPSRLNKHVDEKGVEVAAPKGAEAVPENKQDFSFEHATLNINYVEENLHTLDQQDPQLIQYARIRYLSPPSRLPYNLEGKGSFKDEFSQWVANFFGNKTDGIFIEAGAHEGEKASHTLYLEKELGWTGLLVECNPTVIPYLKSKHRKAWIAGVCLAPTTTPGVLNFSNPTNWTYSGTFKKPWNLPVPTKWTFFDVDTLPFYTILAAVGWKEIDYFSFDIEGMELGVLKTLPFDQVIFKILVIEIMFYTAEEKKELDALLISKGYHFVRKMQVDHVYVHNSVKYLLKQ